MPNFSFASAESTLTGTADTVVGYDNFLTNNIIALCTGYHERMPITRIHFWKLPSGDFKFKVNLADGRTWLQEIKFTGPNDVDPYIHHDMADDVWWTVSEITAHNNLRQQLINVRSQEGLTDWDWKPL